MQSGLLSLYYFLGIFYDQTLSVSWNQTISFEEKFQFWQSCSRTWCHCLQINVGRSLQGIARFLLGIQYCDIQLNWFQILVWKLYLQCGQRYYLSCCFGFCCHLNSLTIIFRCYVRGGSQERIDEYVLGIQSEQINRHNVV